VDNNRFDHLAREFARASASRRRILSSSVAALAAIVVGRRDSGAAEVLRAPGQICRKNGDCLSNLCLPKDRTGRQYCGCVNAGHCGSPGVCKTAQCVNNACVTHNSSAGTPCSDGDPCTIGDKCLNGVCIPGTPLECDGQRCFNGSCCTPTCGPNNDSCDETVSDGCGGMVNCSCSEGEVCTNHVCVPEQCLPSCGNACGTNVEDGCGGVIPTCSCANGQVCSDSVCVTDDTGSPCEDGTDCLSGNCALDGLSPNTAKVCCPAGLGHCGGTCCASASAACYAGGCCESAIVTGSGTICCAADEQGCSFDCCSGAETCQSDAFDPGTYGEPLCCATVLCKGVCCPSGSLSCDVSGNCASPG
jgi:hypothetical protein